MKPSQPACARKSMATILAKYVQDGQNEFKKALPAPRVEIMIDIIPPVQRK